ncbi:MAG: nucleotidyl transferase AbiEii/AbiGii toxin family protein [Steroidobacteraceae bacterium]
MLNNDYKEMLQCLSEENVKFLLVGAYAVAAYGFPRATKDIDILVRPTRDNASSLMRALSRFGAPLGGVSADDFSTEGVVFQIGNSPRRIDILTRISGVEFQQAYERRRIVELEGIEVPVISLKDLIVNKRATGRTQDLADAERLESIPPGD